MSTVVVTTGARLHFGLLIGGRPDALSFSGIGAMISSPGWTIRVGHSSGHEHQFVFSDRIAQSDLPPAARYVAALCPGQSHALRVEADGGIPRHVGLGSGTQFAFALEAAVRALLQQDRPGGERELCERRADESRTQRGRRSRVGRIGFRHGGFVYNGFVESDDRRLRFPGDWSWLLVRPRYESGLHGRTEQQAFETMAPMPETLVGRLTETIHAEILPAVSNADFDTFATALGSYGRAVGAFFAEHQGSVMASPDMLNLADSLAAAGFHGAAQSSWGPLIAVPCRSAAHAAEVRQHVHAHPHAERWRIDEAHPLNERGHTLHIDGDT